MVQKKEVTPHDHGHGHGRAGSGIQETAVMGSTYRVRSLLCHSQVALGVRTQQTHTAARGCSSSPFTAERGEAGRFTDLPRVSQFLVSPLPVSCAAPRAVAPRAPLTLIRQDQSVNALQSALFCPGEGEACWNTHIFITQVGFSH